MATPIFQRQETALGGIFTSDKVKLILSSGSGCGKLVGVLVQGMSFQYSQNITRLYEVGSNGGNNQTQLYYVGGRTNGSAQISRVIGPNATITTMYSCYGDVCKACNNDLGLEMNMDDCGQGCNGGGNARINYTLKFCVLTTVAVSVQAQDMIVGENCTLMFSGLEYTG